MSTRTRSPELERALQEARLLALRTGRSLDSLHLLIAVVTGDSASRGAVGEAGGDVESLGSFSREGEERADVVADAHRRARVIAEGCGSRYLEPLHLLLALERCEGSRAQSALVASGADLTQLRRLALVAIRQRPRNSPAQVRATPADDGAEEAVATTPAPPSVTERQAATPRRPRTEVPAATEREEAGEASPFALPVDEFPLLNELGRNLTALAAAGRLDPVIGRERQIEEVSDILGKRHANNPILIGEAGVGKTAIVEKIAQLAAAGKGGFANKIIVEVPVSSLLAGTAVRGSLSERMATLREEVKRAGGRIIIFFDETHQLVGAGAVGEGSLDMAGELRTVLARGEFPCIGATTVDEYRKIIRESPSMDRRFDSVLVPEPTPEEALEIVRGVIDRYDRHHRAKYDDDALDAAVRLATRYVSERHLPEKALSVIDLAGSRAHRAGKTTVELADVASVVSRIADIPVEKLLQTDTDRLLHMEEHLARRIIGHESVLKRVARVIRRNYAGFAGKRPIGSFLFLGPTGVGKTETVRCLADFLFQSRDAMVRLDMSEYAEPHTVARLIGSPPGYVGHEEGGQLTEAMRRRPYQIVLLDEVEKAHRDVLLVLLQLLDDGRLTDGRGRTVDFSNAVLVMTSNLGSDLYRSRKARIGFSFGRDEGDAEDDIEMSDEEADEIAKQVVERAKDRIPIELWNRIDEKQVFRPLTADDVRQVARLLVAESSESLQQERGITFELTDDAVTYLIEHGGYDPALGARPMRQALQRLVEAPIAEEILSGNLERGDRAVVAVEDDKLVVGKRKSDA